MARETPSTERRQLLRQELRELEAERTPDHINDDLLVLLLLHNNIPDVRLLLISVQSEFLVSLSALFSFVLI